MNGQLEQLAASASSTTFGAGDRFHFNQSQSNVRETLQVQELSQNELHSNFLHMVGSTGGISASDIRGVSGVSRILNTHCQPEQGPILTERTPKSPKLVEPSSRRLHTPLTDIFSSDYECDDHSDDSVIDAMGSTSGNLHHDTTGIRRASMAYFGPSSAVTFMSYLQNAISKNSSLSPSGRAPGERLCDSIPVGESTEWFGRTSVWETPGVEGTGFNPLEFSLPFRRHADTLLSSYWVSVYSLYPFLHKATFLARYAQIWEPAREEPSSPRSQGSDKWKPVPPTPHDKLFYCTLNTVFALGCSFHPQINAQDRAAMSEVYFKRAKRLMTFDILEHGSIQLVQVLLLLGQYLQSTDMVGSCWNIVGLAIRIAQGIGLHLDCLQSSPGRDAPEGRVSKMSQMQVEIKKRVWGGCVLLDRYVTKHLHQVNTFRCRAELSSLYIVYRLHICSHLPRPDL